MTSETEVKNLPLIDIAVQDPIWENLGDVEGVIHEAASRALESAVLPRLIENHNLEMTIALANDDLVQVLNREYRNKDKPTNVLSFASIDSDDFEQEAMINPFNLGDIIFSYQTIERECQEQGKFLLDHIKHLTVHGVLHLLGYDHENDDDATNMETLEIRILEQLNVQNPYTDTGINA
jgi:probable rRNA maturation factor